MTPLWTIAHLWWSHYFCYRLLLQHHQLGSGRATYGWPHFPSDLPSWCSIAHACTHQTFIIHFNFNWSLFGSEEFAEWASRSRMGLLSWRKNDRVIKLYFNQLNLQTPWSKPPCRLGKHGTRPTGRRCLTLILQEQTWEQTFLIVNAQSAPWRTDSHDLSTLWHSVMVQH